MRIGDKCGPRLFKYRHRKFPTDGRKIVQKDLQRISGFQVIEQRLDRDTRASENGSSAVNFWIDGDQLCLHGKPWVRRPIQYSPTAPTRRLTIGVRRAGKALADPAGQERVGVEPGGRCARILGCVHTPHNYAYLATVYACGLRLTEALYLIGHFG